MILYVYAFRFLHAVGEEILLSVKVKKKHLENGYFQSNRFGNNYIDFGSLFKKEICSAFLLEK